MRERQQQLFRTSLLILFISPTICQAQKDQNDPDIHSLFHPVTKSEAIMADAEQNIIIADSLIHNGHKLLDEAEEVYHILTNQIKVMSKAHLRRKKQLEKMCKSQNSVVVSKASAELLKLEEERRISMKPVTVKIQEMVLMAQRGEADIELGQQLKEDAEYNQGNLQKTLLRSAISLRWLSNPLENNDGKLFFRKI